jgi:histidine triad (HIT) family protein
MDCIFCKIVRKEIPATFLAEDDAIVVFKDIKPSAPVHCLVVPRRHVASVASITEADRDIVFGMVTAAKRVAEDLKLTGYKLVFNVGREGGQIIDHLHLHLLGGWKLGEGGHLPHPGLDK